MTDRCFICGDDNPNVLQEHHAVPRRFGGSDDNVNVVTLCANCHEAVEKIYDEAFYKRLGIESPELPEPEPGSMEQSVKIVEAFVNECVETERGGFVKTDTFYECFCNFARSHFSRHPPSREIVGKALSQSERIDIEGAQKRVDGGVVRIYRPAELTERGWAFADA
jgi:hypothetical protein